MQVSAPSKSRAGKPHAAFCRMFRFLWNKALALEKEAYETEGKRLGYHMLAGKLKDWKKEDDTFFLAEAHSQILQQALKDLDRAYKGFFAKRADFPRFKRKGVHDAFRYPQGFKLDEGNIRILLPKIGWAGYRKGRGTEGTPKQVTVSLSAGKWFISIQTEREVPESVRSSQSAVGIDMGLARFATFSDGSSIRPLHSFCKHEKKLAALQRKLAKRTKFSANWQKLKKRIQRLHRKIADVRNDFLHKLTTSISKNHALVVLEDLKVRNMSRSATGSVDAPGKSVRAKAGLNKSIPDQGWFEFRRQLPCKLAWLGGKPLVVPPRYTSQTCSRCGCVDKNSRPTQAKFKCTACGFECNADHNAALNILAAGQAVSA
nr:transposase [uncultured Desulfovibrio sp.]